MVDTERNSGIVEFAHLRGNRIDQGLMVLHGVYGGLFKEQCDVVTLKAYWPRLHRLEGGR